MKHIRLIIFLALAALAACSSGDDTRLAVADSLLEQRPDSAMAILRSVDSHKLDKGNRAYYALLFTAAQYKCYEPIVSDSLIDIAVDYYAGSSDHNRRLRSLIFKGAALEEMGDQLAAIDWYKKAESEASPTDFENIGYINLRLGGLYTDLFIDNHEDLQKYKKALLNYEKTGNQNKRLSSLLFVGGLYRKSNKDSAYFYLNRAKTVAQEIQDTARYYYALQILARAYYVDSLFNNAKNLSVYIIQHGGKYVSDDSYYDAANAYVALHRQDSAKFYFNLAKPKGLSDIGRVDRLTTLTNILKAEGNYKDAFVTNEVCNELAHRITDKRNKMQMFQYEKYFDYQLYKNENKRMKSERFVLYLLTILGFLIILSVSLMLRYRKLQIKNNQLTIAQLQEESSRIREMLQSGEGRENELKTAMGNRISNIRQLIDLSYSLEGKPALFMKAFRQTVKSSKTSKNTSFIEDIIKFVNLNHDNLIERIAIKYPMLKEEELAIIALLRCGFSYIEISICMGYENPNYVNTKKLRIARKMGLKVSLKNHIENFKP